MWRTSGTSERRNEWCFRPRSLKRKSLLLPLLRFLECGCLVLLGLLSLAGGGGRGGNKLGGAVSGSWRRIIEK